MLIIEFMWQIVPIFQSSTKLRIFNSIFLPSSPHLQPITEDKDVWLGNNKGQTSNIIKCFVQDTLYFSTD